MKYMGLQECLAPRETWGFLRTAKKAYLLPKWYHHVFEGPLSLRLRLGRGKGQCSGVLSPIGHRILGAGVGSSLSLMSQEAE